MCHTLLCHTPFFCLFWQKIAATFCVIHEVTYSVIHFLYCDFLGHTPAEQPYILSYFMRPTPTNYCQFFQSHPNYLNHPNHLNHLNTPTTPSNPTTPATSTTPSTLTSSTNPSKPIRFRLDSRLGLEIHQKFLS